MNDENVQFFLKLLNMKEVYAAKARLDSSGISGIFEQEVGTLLGGKLVIKVEFGYNKETDLKWLAQRKEFIN